MNINDTITFSALVFYLFKKRNKDIREVQELPVKCGSQNCRGEKK